MRFAVYQALMTSSRLHTFATYRTFFCSCNNSYQHRTYIYAIHEGLYIYWTQYVQIMMVVSCYFGACFIQSSYHCCSSGSISRTYTTTTTTIIKQPQHQGVQFQWLGSILAINLHANYFPCYCHRMLSPPYHTDSKKWLFYVPNFTTIVWTNNYYGCLELMLHDNLTAVNGTMLCKVLGR